MHNHHFLLKNIKYFCRLNGGIEKLSEDIQIDSQTLNKILKGSKEINLKQLIFISEISSFSLQDLVFTDLEKKYNILQKLNIRLLILDIDGVMTDGGMYYSESGDEFKKFNTKDGIAIKKVKKAGIKVGFLSSGFNHQLIKNRGNLLGVDLIHSGENPKIEILEKWIKMLDLDFNSVAYIGDDVNDIECMKMSGISACPSDAADKVKAISDIILINKGGNGCVREFCEKYLDVIK